jgi:hypothetical protein
VLPGFAAKIVAIRTSGPFRARFSIFDPPATKNEPLFYAEYLAEGLLLDLPHRQFVFIIPNIPRQYFESGKRLFGEVSRLIFSLLSEFFSLPAGQELLCPCAVSYQFFQGIMTVRRLSKTLKACKIIEWAKKQDKEGASAVSKRACSRRA